MNNLLQRIITGVLGGTLIIVGVMWNQYSFVGLFFLISSLVHFEYLKLCETNESYGKSKINLILNLIAGMYLYVVINFSILEIINGRLILPVFIFFPLFFIGELFKKSATPFQNIGLNVGGIIYIVLPFCLLSILSVQSTNDFYPEYTLAILFTVWSYDTFAYFTGKYFGKHKLFERISPNKTWEGFFGGLIGGLLCTYIFSIYFKEFSISEWLTLGLIIVIAGTFGDLVESMFKRSLNVKDSSNILPGHGGFFDRFDAFIMAVPFAFLYLLYIGALSSEY